MSKKYGLTGLGTLVELGKAGVQLKANAGQVEVRNAADDALVKLKALDGTASDDLVTLNQLNNVTVSGVVNYRTATLAFNTTSPLNIGATVTGTYAYRWQVIVTTAFDGTAPTLDLGVAGTTDAIAPNTNIDLTTIGVYSGTSSLDITSSTQIIGTYVADASTVGAADIIIEWF